MGPWPLKQERSAGMDPSTLVSLALQVVQLECLRRGIWGTKSLWGRVLTYKGS
jgi:hypothetical protein